MTALPLGIQSPGIVYGPGYLNCSVTSDLGPLSGQLRMADLRRLTDLYQQGPPGGIFYFRHQAVETAFRRSYRG